MTHATYKKKEEEHLNIIYMLIIYKEMFNVKDVFQFHYMYKYDICEYYCNRLYATAMKTLLQNIGTI